MQRASVILLLFAGEALAHPNRWSLRRNGELRELQALFNLPSPSKFYNLPLKAGEVLVIETGGGGGFGDPRERSRVAVERDRRDGYVLT